MDVEYTDAVRTVITSLAAGGDDFAAAGAISLALRAWRQLGGTDPVWDQVGLDLLEVRDRLYPDQDVTVAAADPAADPQTRAAVAELLEQLALHHQQLAGGDAPLAERLAHDAGVQQLRDAAAALA